MIKLIILVLISNSGSVFAHFCLKKLANKFPNFKQSIIDQPFSIFFDYWMLIGCIGFFFSLLISILIYTENEMIKITPISFSYQIILVTLIAYFFLNERLTIINGIGILLIFSGTYLLLLKEGMYS